jgi:predicted nucleotidyltransferase
VAIRALDADPGVVGVALVGSFGRGQADDWSDLDLLVVIADASYAEWILHNALWDQAELLWFAPQNTRATATSAGTLHVQDELPVGVDWYVYPATEAAWPADAMVISGDTAVDGTDVAFADWNARGPRGSPRGTSPEHQLAIRIAMTTIAGKYVARRRSDAASMIELITGETTADDRPTQLAESFVHRAASPSLARPILSYLGQIREFLGAHVDAS